MEQSHSETSSEEIINELRDNLIWTSAIAAVLLQNEGGVVEIDRETLAGIDVSRARMEVKYDELRDIYVIEGIYDETP